MKKILLLLVIVCSILLMSFAIKGQKGNPIYFQKEKDVKVGGPFESTNSTSRYALTVAIVENHSFYFTDSLAKFSTPDIVKAKDHYFSIFTPGVSFFTVPFYIIGKYIGLPQLLTYVSIALLALLNFYLVTRIANKLGAGFLASLISGFLFLFATNSLAYALTLTQHQASITLLLLAILTAFGEISLEKDIFLGVFFGAAVMVDIPNALMMMPILMYVFFKHFSTREQGEKITFSFKPHIFAFLLGVMPFILAFAIYNHMTTGSYTLLAQNVGRSAYKVDTKKKVISTHSTFFVNGGTFVPRRQLNGFYILLISNERGIFYYCPILLIGLLGMYLGIRSKNSETKNVTVVMFGVILINFLLYTMFDDPWGGWSFGPRYLLPAEAMFATCIGLALQKYKKNWIFIGVFFILTSYSIWVSTLGALTTNAIPPKQEAVALVSPIPYTYKYNIELLHKGFTSSLLYNLYFARKLSVELFLYFYDALIIIILDILFILLWRQKHERRQTL